MILYWKQGFGTQNMRWILVLYGFVITRNRCWALPMYHGKDTPKDSCVTRCLKACTIRTKHFMSCLCFMSAPVPMGNGPCRDRVAEKIYFMERICFACCKVPMAECSNFATD